MSIQLPDCLCQFFCIPTSIGKHNLIIIYCSVTNEHVENKTIPTTQKTGSMMALKNVQYNTNQSEMWKVGIPPLHVGA